MKKAIVIAIAVIMTVNHSVIAGTITGTVEKESNGKPIVGLWVEATDYYTGQYRGGASTNSSGFYVIQGLIDGTYRIMVSTWNTDFVEEYYNNVYDYYNAAPIVVPANGVVQNIDFSLKVGLKASGKVVDKATGSALDNIRVACWHIDFERYTSVYTNINGIYELTHLLPGDVQITAEPESYYARIGAGLELTGDIDRLDFALPAGANLSGKVIDSQTAQPLARIEVTYWNNSNSVFQNDFTHGDGTFTLKNLPPGVATIKARPDIDTGYALWNPPLGGNMIYINEGEDEPNQIIALHKGALVKGDIKDHYDIPMSDFGYSYSGRLCEGDSETDPNGEYKIRLPVGTYSITLDEDDFGALPQEVIITDVNLPFNVPDMIAYSEQTGGQITGSVINPGGHQKTGNFIIAAFETGTVFDPNTWHTIWPIRKTGLHKAGPFTITSLPPDVNYDVFLFVESDTLDEIGSVTVRDSVLNVPAGTTGINLYYNSQGSTVTGKVLDTNSQPVFGAIVLFFDLATGDFAGLADVDYKGNYIIYNVPAGTYTITAIHSKCLNTPPMEQEVDGELVNVSTIVITCTGE
jgi:hypothetical protein